MDELSPLGAIGMGLSAAGGALNQDVYNQNVNIQTQQTAQDAKKKEFLADLLTKHYQAGTLTGPAYQQAMGKLGFDIPAPGATPDYSGAATQVTTKLDQGGYLGGGSGGGLGGQGGSPVTPNVPTAGAPPGPPQFGGGTALAGGGGPVGGGAGFGATGSEVPGAAQNIPPVAATPAPVPADQALPPVEVTGKKTSVYGVDEINQATADYAKSISGQPGTIQAKQKAVKDFRDSLKAERKSQLDELNKESEVKKRDNDIQISQRDRFRTPLLNNLDALAKMDKSDPRYAPLKAAIDKETAGDNTTGFMKELKANLIAGGLTEGSPEYNKQYALQTQKHLDKQDAPPSYVFNANQSNSVIPPEHADLHGDDYLKTLPAGQAGVVKAISEGRAPLSALGMGKQKAEMVQRVSQFDPTFDAGNYAARAATRKSFTSGPDAKNVTAINTAIGHIGTMYELGNALGNNDVKALNNIVNKVAGETGNPKVVSFDIARSAVANELMRVFRQVGASEAETNDWAAKFSHANSPAQLKAAAQTATELLGSRIDAVNDQWKRGMNTDQGYPNLLSPKSADVLKKIGKFDPTTGTTAVPPTSGGGWKIERQ